MFTGTLKEYQTDAVKRMVEHPTMLVAYEMGLGKTVITIAALEELRRKRVLPTRKKSIVVVLCLSSLKYQWKNELEKFTDRHALVIDGTPKQRQDQYSQIPNYDFVVMNYEQVLNDWTTVRELDIVAIVCDEATAIKGFRAKRAKKVKELAKKIPIRFALTGTPIENGKPEELFSIMEFVDRRALGRFDVFDKAFIVRNHFGWVERYQNLDLLNKRLEQYVLRKSQQDPDVAPHLPDATYRPPLHVPLDPQAKKLYNHIASDLLELLTSMKSLLGSNFSLSAHYGQGRNYDEQTSELRGAVMARIGALRMLCSHPGLLLNSYVQFKTQSGKGSSYIHSLGELGLLSSLKKTPKMDTAIGYLIDHLDIDQSYKAVVFSSYIGTVDALVQRLNNRGYAAVKYTGEMSAKEKHDAKVSFQTSSEIRVLVSSDAGGYGVDLPQANLLLNYDQPWSAGLSVQRNGRINRTSSTWKSITIQDVIAKDSIEQRQYDMLQQKKSVSGAVLDGVGLNSKGGVDMTVGTLIQFLTTRIT